MNEDLLIQKFIKLEERVERIEENMATKSDVDRILGAIDDFVGTMKKHDQEITFLGEKVKRVQNFVGMPQ